MSYYIQQGHRYIGGASRPFFVSKGMLINAAQNKGFTDVEVVDRSAYPAASLPPLPAGTSNDWDTVGIGTRVIPSGSENLPGAVRWVVDITPTAVKQPLPEPAPPTVPLDPGDAQPPQTGLPSSWEPPVYPTRVEPGTIGWTTQESLLSAPVFAAVLFGTVGALVYIGFRG